MANTKISQLPLYSGSAADLRWFVMNNSGETETFKFSGYTSPYKRVGTNNSNNIYDTTAMGGSYCAIIGGSGNQIPSGSDSAAIGGNANNISGTRSVIAGGTNQTLAASDSFIGGGYYNNLQIQYSTILGGIENTIAGSNSYTFFCSNSNYTTTNGYSMNNTSVIGSRDTNLKIYGDYDQHGGTAIVGSVGSRIDGNSNGDQYRGGRVSIISSEASSAKTTDDILHYNNTLLATKNSIIINGDNSGIIGGESNTLNTTQYGFIGGGNNNLIDNSNNSQILGGSNNTINCETAGSERFNTIINGSGNTISDAADDQKLQTIINSVNTTLQNGVDRVTAIGLSGRTINDAASGTTYVENLKAFRQIASSFYDNGSIPQAGYTINLNNGDKQQITITGSAGNTNLYFIGNLAGGRLVLKVINTSTGDLGFADAAPYDWKIPAVYPSASPSATDVYIFESFGDQALWFASQSKNLS